MFFLPKKSSKLRLRDAQNARRNRLEIVKALSQGTVTRRELIKWGLLTSAGFLAHKGGLSPFASAFAQSRSSNIPTGFPPSVLPGNVTPFSQPMPRFDVLPRIANPMTAFAPTPTAAANTTQQLLDPALVAAYPGGNMGPKGGGRAGSRAATTEYGMVCWPSEILLAKYTNVGAARRPANAAS